MKKLISLLLILCLAFLAATALAEDYTGTWYLVRAVSNGTTVNIDGTGMSITFTLNADGSCDMAMSVAGLALWVGTYLIGQLTPWMLENLTPAGTFFLFAFCCLPYLYIMWKYIPETTGKTLEEIEAYWKK